MKRVLAHGTNTDASISAEIHIDPNDRPTIGKEAKFYFTFQDSSGQFQLQQCDCSIILIKDDIEVDKHSIVLSDSDSIAALGSTPLYTKTFAEVGDYELKLSGRPKAEAKFQPFNLLYEVRVQEHVGNIHSVDSHTFAGEHLGHILIFGGGLIVSIFLLIRNYMKNRKIKENTSSA